MADELRVERGELEVLCTEFGHFVFDVAHVSQPLVKGHRCPSLVGFALAFAADD